MTKFQKIDKAEVKRLLNKALFKTFFHSPEWQDFLEKQFNWLKFEHYLYRDEFLFALGRVGRKLISLPFCEYGGPLPLKKDINYEQFEKDVLEEFKNIKIKVHPRIFDYFKNSEFRIQNLESGVFTHWIEDLDRKSEKDFLKSFRKTLRHSIRNAQKKDLEIKKCQNLAELKQFYNLYVDNLRRKKTVPYPFSIIKFLYNNPDSELLLAWHKGKIIAGDLFLHYGGLAPHLYRGRTPDTSSGKKKGGGFIHYFLSASDYKYRNLGASYLILWNKIKTLIGKDVIFDLGAAPKGSVLETFKRGWRGKEYPVLQIGIKRSEERLRSSKLRNIWSLLPNFVIKIISRYFIKYRI